MAKKPKKVDVARPGSLESISKIIRSFTRLDYKNFYPEYKNNFESNPLAAYGENELFEDPKFVGRSIHVYFCPKPGDLEKLRAEIDMYLSQQDAEGEGE
jgi:hypothetical protein